MVQDITTLGSHQAHSFPVEKDESEMREYFEGILESLFAPPRPFCNPSHLPKISGEERHDLIGLSVVTGLNHNGIRRVNWHN
jgi:hypothetical protein